MPSANLAGRLRALKLRTAARAVLLGLALCPASSPLAQTLEEARSLHASGRLPEALEAYVAVASALAESDPGAAGTACNNACVIEMNTGDLRGALDHCVEALRLRRLASDDRSVARTLNNLGLVRQYLTEYETAEGHFREALALNARIGDVEGQVINLANLGVLATGAGRYADAMGFYRRVMGLADGASDQPWARRQRLLAQINLAVVLEHLGAYREALELYRLVRDETAELEPRQRAGLAVNVGVVYRNLGDPVSALRAFEEALESYDLLGDTSGKSNALLNVGLVHHLNLERPGEAESAYREALRLAEVSGDRSEEIRDLCHLGRLLLDNGREEEAEPLFRRALREADAAGSNEGRWTSLHGLARVLASGGDLDGSLELLYRAIDDIERTRSKLERASLRGTFFGERRPVYVTAVDVLYRLSLERPGAGFQERAFDVVQRAKARGLLDALGPIEGGLHPLEAGEVAGRLPDGLLLEYFVGETDVYLWAIGEGRVVLRCLGPAEPILDAVAEVHRDLAAGLPPAPAALSSLSDALFSDLADSLRATDHVRIAPDGRLHYLPFEMLPVGADGSLLIDVARVSYLPSGSTLGRPTGGPPAPPLAYVAFGAPVLAPATSVAEGARDLVVSRFGLADLRAATRELDEVRSWLAGAGEVRVGAEATETAFRDLAGRGARVVHLASHAVVDERHGRGAALLLTPDDGSDGLLTPDEIATLRYPVDLTVLAACRTALGSEGDGYALASLTGAFLAAGSSAVVATLWDVGDEATRAFMEQFYDRLRRGEVPADALRRAKRRFLADPDWDDAHVWAAYVLIGEAGPVATASRTWIAYPVAAAIVLCALALWRRRRPRGRVRKRGFGDGLALRSPSPKPPIGTRPR